MADVPPARGVDPLDGLTLFAAAAAEESQASPSRGRQLAAAVLAALEGRYAELLHELRGQLAVLARQRPVTADDANRLLDDWGYPPHQQKDRRWVGQVFRAQGWYKVGTGHSARARNHGRLLDHWCHDAQ